MFPCICLAHVTQPQQPTDQITGQAIPDHSHTDNNIEGLATISTNHLARVKLIYV